MLARYLPLPLHRPELKALLARSLQALPARCLCRCFCCNLRRLCWSRRRILRVLTLVVVLLLLHQLCLLLLDLQQCMLCTIAQRLQALPLLLKLVLLHHRR